MIWRFFANISDERVEWTRTRRGSCGDGSLRYLLITQLLLLSSVAFAGDKPASCELVGKSVVSRSSSGLAQVSNLGDIQITCSASARPYSWGESRSPLKIATVGYQVLPDGSKKLVPSETNQTGGSYARKWSRFTSTFIFRLSPRNAMRKLTGYLPRWRSRCHLSKLQRRRTSGRWNGFASSFTNIGLVISKWSVESWTVTA